jgi:fused signal recognition particle receptor
MVFDIFRRRARPDAAQPDAAQPDAAQPDAAGPDASRSDGSPPAPEGAGVPESLERTRGSFFGAVRSLFQGRRELDESFWDDLEERLLQADVGAHTTADLVDLLRERHARQRFETPEQAERVLQEELVKLLGTDPPDLNLPRPLAVVLVVGVNGVGKTTSIAKLAHYLAAAGRRPLLVAGDTFRAAAIDQLKVWGERVDVPVVAQGPGSDPSAVVFDGIQAARGRGADVLIVDTAGRLHTKVNLMEELKKVCRVIQRQIPDAPHETLLVLDAVTGQNALIQAKTFAEAVGVTGLVLAKLDSSSKGGVVFSIAQELGTPIKLVGTGEKAGDLAPFDPQEFVAALFA